MAITGAGFDGTLTEADWARIAGPAGVPDQSVPGASTTDLAVTRSITALTATLTATVAPGTYNRHGVLAKSTATETVTFTNPASGSRWDLVALLYDWTTNSITLTVVQGGTTRALPTASMETTPGTKAHVPLALVELTAGNAAPTRVMDLRAGMWHTATPSSNYGMPGGSGDGDPAWMFDGTLIHVRGSVAWNSGSGQWVAVIEVPMPSTGTIMCGMAAANSGGVAPLLVYDTAVLVCAEKIGTWTLGAIVRLSGSYAALL